MGFYRLYGGKNFTKWLQNNEQEFKLFYKPLRVDNRMMWPKFNFILKCPPGTLKSDEIASYASIFELHIMGSINPYGTSYLKRKRPKLPVKSEEEFKPPKLKRRTNCSCPAIIISMDEKGNFHYI